MTGKCSSKKATDFKIGDRVSVIYTGHNNERATANKTEEGQCGIVVKIHPTDGDNNVFNDKHYGCLEVKLDSNDVIIRWSQRFEKIQ